jgi:hypothetical protein
MAAIAIPDKAGRKSVNFRPAGDFGMSEVIRL